MLAIESIGQLCLLDSDLFSGWSVIFKAILTDVFENHSKDEHINDDTLKETLIALKSSIDAMIVHGTTSETPNDLLQIIF